ncbi:Protein DEK [Trichoplax sp. H2]|nr:Protein DEK [Trichoplax sp. H2]|eukprot:RDD46222.1 Protein DEK [Trichoplax sp. H2]
MSTDNTAATKTKDEIETSEANEDSGVSENGDDNTKHLGIYDKPLIQEGARVRKTTDRLHLKIPVKVKTKIDFSTGKGERLGDISQIETAVTGSKADTLKPLHRLLFGRPGSATEVKRNIRDFRGFNFDTTSDEYQTKEKMLSKMTSSDLRNLCGIICVQRGASKVEMIEHIMEFLLVPSSSGAQGSTRSSGKKPKRPKTAKKPPRKEKQIKTKSPTKKKKRKAKTVVDDFDSSDEEPLAKKMKKDPPTDSEIEAAITKLLDGADLQNVTIKSVCRELLEEFPDIDISSQKDFIKSTIFSIIN